MENAINKTGAPLTFDFLGKSCTQCHYGGSTRLGGLILYLITKEKRALRCLIWIKANFLTNHAIVMFEIFQFIIGLFVYITQAPRGAFFENQYILLYWSRSPLINPKLIQKYSFPACHKTKISFEKSKRNILMIVQKIGVLFHIKLFQWRTQ